MNEQSKIKLPIWQRLIKIVVIIIATFASSQVATTNPILDVAVKNAIVSVSNVMIDALSSNSADTAIIIQAKSDSLYRPVQTIK